MQFVIDFCSIMELMEVFFFYDGMLALYTYNGNGFGFVCNRIKFSFQAPYFHVINVNHVINYCGFPL